MSIPDGPKRDATTTESSNSPREAGGFADIGNNRLGVTYRATVISAFTTRTTPNR